MVPGTWVEAVGTYLMRGTDDPATKELCRYSDTAFPCNNSMVRVINQYQGSFHGTP